MVESITTDPMKTELQKLVKFMFSQIESISLDCGKRKIAGKDKRAAFAHECAQDLLNFRDAGTPHFEVWSQLMEASAMGAREILRQPSGLNFIGICMKIFTLLY